jgi:histidinol dehydrogenase
VADGPLRIRRLSAADGDFSDRLRQLTFIEASQDSEIDRIAAGIIDEVRQRGDKALLEYSKRFDRLSVTNVSELEIPRESLDRALADLDVRTREALEAAAARIARFHERQKAVSWQFTDDDGSTLGQQVQPLDRVGIYVPGGKASYPSSVLMNAIPAKVAGVSEVIMVVPTPDGERNALVLAAAALAGVDRVFTIGGAQAVAALAYGTESIPSVDKIVGPGNAYVAAAKRRVFGTVGIDMIAGPSEILIVADGTTPADWVAMDLFSQAEHDEMAQSILISTSASYLDQVEISMNRLLESMPRRSVIRASIENRGAFILVGSISQACDIANDIAPEHLELSIKDAESWVGRIRHAGAIFCGGHSSESLGDYCAGPNHVLPTARTARFSSPLGVYDFQKRTSVIAVSVRGAASLGRVASILARGEGLEAHARSAELRYEQPPEKS